MSISRQRSPNSIIMVGGSGDHFDHMVDGPRKQLTKSTRPSVFDLPWRELLICNFQESLEFPIFAKPCLIRVGSCSSAVLDVGLGHLARGTSYQIRV